MTPKRALIWAAVSTTPQADEDEKFSIPKQIEDGERMANENGWRIVDTLVVPGHSRDYRTLEQLAADARKKDIDAFDRLIKHFRDHDFDIFICRDANRFARKASLLHYIAEMIIEDCGALIYSQSDNMYIDDEKLPWWATIQGYKVRAEVKALVDGRNNGMDKRAQRGLPTSSTLLRTHLVIRDEFGRALRMEVDEDQRRLWDDVYHLLTEQHNPWGQIEDELFKLGHIADDGKAIRQYAIRDIVASPTFWGHSARFHTKNGHTRHRGWEWAYNLNLLPPDGVQLYRNTHPAVYQGEQAQHVIAELDRRRVASRGRSRPYRSHRYAGLIVCRDCGYYMTYVGSVPELYLSCQKNKQDNQTCSNRKSLKPSVIDAYIAGIQKRLQAGESLLSVLAIDDTVNQLERRRQQLTTEIEAVTEESKGLIRKQRKAPGNMVDFYDEQIVEVSEHLTSLTKQLDALNWNTTYDFESQEREAVDFAKLGDRLWELDDTEINARLHRVFGHRRMSGYLAEIVGFEDAPKKQPPPRRLRSRKKK